MTSMCPGFSTYLRWRWSPPRCLLSPAALTPAPAEAVGTEGSPGTRWEGSWELPGAPLLCRVWGETKMCWKRCKSAFPKAEIGNTLESCISPECSSANEYKHSSSVNYSVIRVSSFGFCPAPRLTRFFYYFILSWLQVLPVPQPPPWAPHVAICSFRESDLSVSDQGPAGTTHLCFMYLIYSKCTKWQFIISLSTVKDIITSRNEKKVQPYVEMLYFVHF